MVWGSSLWLLPTGIWVCLYHLCVVYIAKEGMSFWRPDQLMNVTQKNSHLSYSKQSNWAGLDFKTFSPWLESNNLKSIATWSLIDCCRSIRTSKLHWLERTDKHNLKCILNCFVGHSDHRSHIYFRLISNFINRTAYPFCKVYHNQPYPFLLELFWSPYYSPETSWKIAHYRNYNY